LAEDQDGYKGKQNCSKLKNLVQHNQHKNQTMIGTTCMTWWKWLGLSNVPYFIFYMPMLQMGHEVQLENDWHILFCFEVVFGSQMLKSKSY